MIIHLRTQRILYVSKQLWKNSTWRVHLGTALFGIFLSASAQSAVFTVNTPVDIGDANPGNGVCETAPGSPMCSLRAAIEETNALAGEDTIILPHVPTPFFSANELIIAGNLTIMGSGALTTILQGNFGTSRVLVINAGFAVNLSGVSVRGLGILTTGISNSGTLTLRDSTVSNNTGSGISNSGTVTVINSMVSVNSSLQGGGIFNQGTLALINSTVSRNYARSGGGGILNNGTMTLINSTVSGNGAVFDGGGIFNDGTANLFNATITNNQADVNFEGTGGTGGGIFNSNNGTFNFQNTILAGNFETMGFVPIPGECEGTINSIGGNLMTMADCTVTGSAPILADASLGPLEDNGGPTHTHALLADSPAIDAGDPGGCRDEFGALLTTDQRGFNRPALGCDIGAFELQQSSGVVAAVLPSSRSVQVDTPAAAFATVINTGQAMATACSIALLNGLPASFVYQTTDPATNQVIGFPNTPADIAAGAAQSFVFAITPTASIAPTDVQFSFDCADTDPAPINVGLNTLLLSASNTPVPDIVALAATTNNDGIVSLASTGVFAVATVNVGASGSITAAADTGSASLPVSISLCQTDPATSQCISAIGPSVTTQVNADATPTFGIFVEGNGNVPFDPAVNRIFVRFKDSGNITRGSTSVAVRTQ
jgi:CSLREA domain-containing protein